ncbi:MAG TPA: alpha/beta fold hydrolase [Patescibacteria group bacterium]|nr:alpha/beta fold hydrolase [Patescibacteria group bacterium]
MSLIKQNIPSTKGDLAAVIHYPEKETGGLAILCPGYLDTKDYKHLVKLAEELSQKGLVVVRFDPTGTWESAGTISDYTNSQYLIDIRNVLDYMTSQKDYQNILLGGHSRGGQMSILYAARDPRISVVLGIMPSFGPLLGRKREEWEKKGVHASYRDLPEDEEEKREILVPFSHILDRDNYDALEDVKKVHAPVVLVAGELDDLVTSAEVNQIFENANEPKVLITLAGIGHDYRHHDNEVELVNGRIMEGAGPYLFY